MYKVLIVDDEQAIREGLATLLDWESLGYQVIDTAANAIEAKHKYEICSPDLMIVDIRMPGRNGLELIQELLEEDPELRIIILSGYADFSYAKRAMSYGISDYLLKPIDEDELQQCLSSLSTELDARVTYRKKDAAVKKWNQEMLVQSLLIESSPQTVSNVESSVKEFGLIWSAYQVVLIRLFLQDNTDNGPSTVVKSMLTASFDEHKWGIVFSLDSYLGVLIQPSFQKELTRKLMVQNIQETVGSLGLECIISAGNIVEDFNKIPLSYHSALERMKDHFFYEESGMVGPDSIKLKAGLGLPIKPEEVDRGLESIEERLYFAIDVGSNDVISSLIREIGGLMIAAQYSQMAVKSRYIRMVSHLFNKLSLQHKSLYFLHSEVDEQLEQIYKYTTLPALQAHITKLITDYTSRIVRDDTEVLIKRLLNLIHRHYVENLKLDTLAEVFSYNSAYLGKLFKSSTGLSFNSYHDKVRIDKAKELLDQGFKIHQAAHEVGFSDVDYFREKFKKLEGISPSEYRRKNTYL